MGWTRETKPDGKEKYLLVVGGASLAGAAITAVAGTVSAHVDGGLSGV